jgi:glycerophosphoryl diester phosphodiesterase
MNKFNNHLIKAVSCILVIALFTSCSTNKKTSGAEKSRKFAVAGDCRDNGTGSSVNENILSKISSVVPLPGAFAHNDYEHENPLFDALANGFTAIEADVHLINGELYVAHNRPALIKDVCTLRELYLNPLLNHIKNNNGQIYPGYNSPVYLMIDIKTAGEATYAVLRKQLIEYSEILSSLSDINNIPKPVRVFISGNRPIATIKKDSVQLAGVDGRLRDLEKNYSVGFMPIISERFSGIVDWNGIDTIPEKEFETLRSISDKVHQQGKMFRLWGAPENEYTWRILSNAGIDFICTDDLQKAKRFSNVGESNPKTEEK